MTEHLTSTNRRDYVPVLFLVITFLNTSLCDGPVFVNPNNPPAVSIEATSVPLVTQTVYGFLDFTTTIGNTLMIFSPQSQPSPDSSKNEIVATPTSIVTTSAIVNTIEANPSPQTTKQESSSTTETLAQQETITTPSIKPTKTITPTKSSEKKPIDEHKEKTTLTKKSSPSYVVNVKSDTGDATSTPTTTKSTVILSSIVEVKGGTENIKSTPSVVLMSRVDEKPPQTASSIKILSSVVERVENKPTVISSVVNVAVNDNKKDDKIQSNVQIISSKVEVLSNSEEPAISGNNLEGEAEYDFLSRQPSEVVDETYKVIDLRTPNSKAHHHGHHHKNRATNKPEASHPTGLVTSMGGTIVKDGLTTVHETNVIGTYISGKYAQVLQSTSHVYPQQSNKKVKPTPSSQSRILKTSAPNLKSNQKINLEPTPASSTLQEDSALPLEALFNSPSGNLIRQSRRPAINAGSPFKNRFNRNRVSKEEQSSSQDLSELEEQIEQIEDNTPATPPPSYKKGKSRDRDNHRERSNSDNKSRESSNGRSTFKLSGNNRFSRPHQHNQELATVSVYSEPATTNNPGSSRRYQTASPSSSNNNKESKERRGSFKPTSNNNNVDSNQSTNNRRNFKPSKPVNDHSGSTSLYKFKLSRPSGRWQYKTTPKPRVPIRRQDNDLDVTSQTPQITPAQVNNLNIDQGPEDSDKTEQTQQSAVYNNQESPVASDSTVPVETIKVEISTPADFKDTYYEIATVKSPYTFQVGTVKNTRFITVTSTIEKSLVEPTEAPTLQSSEPLTENILASTANAYDKEPPLDSSIATLPPIALALDAETPPLETMTESFSTTQLMLKTHILPVIRGADNTTSYTLVQSYHVTRIVTATKTLPPMEVYQFVPSKTLNEFNTRLDEAGSELHLELEFGDNNDQNDDENPTAARAFPPDLDLANVGSEFNLSDMDKTKFLTDPHLRLKKAHHQLTTTDSTPTTPSLSAEQLQQLALLRFLNPNAIPPVITSSKPVIKLETVYESHVIPLFNGQSTLFSTISRPIATVSKTEYELVTSALPMPQQPQLNPLFPQQQQIPQQPQIPQIPQIPQQQFALTSTPVVTQTIVTATDSKVLKLTFGAKTAFTTLYSTKVVPTVLTTYLTASVPVQPTVAAFPGYFPAPYNPYNPFAG